mmetsp:Transcript_23073/g.46156  ORF Transcript_23073/g.46156 Transcript_23073/m.46156 type:complete len:276 (-) Transcript_23073:92-919(-)
MRRLSTQRPPLVLPATPGYEVDHGKPIYLPYKPRCIPTAWNGPKGAASAWLGGGHKDNPHSCVGRCELCKRRAIFEGHKVEDAQTCRHACKTCKVFLCPHTCWHIWHDNLKSPSAAFTAPVPAPAAPSPSSAPPSPAAPPSSATPDPALPSSRAERAARRSPPVSAIRKLHKVQRMQSNLQRSRAAAKRASGAGQGGSQACGSRSAEGVRASARAAHSKAAGKKRAASQAKVAAMNAAKRQATGSQQSSQQPARKRKNPESCEPDSSSCRRSRRN